MRTSISNNGKHCTGIMLPFDVSTMHRISQLLPQYMQCLLNLYS